MASLPVTTITASVLAAFYVLLSFSVGLQRVFSKTGLGAGTDVAVALGHEKEAPRLLIMVRRHGNFAEYVPISLVLLLILELSGANRNYLILLAGALVVARLMAAIGIGQPAPNVFRAGGMTLQWLMILGCAWLGVAPYVLH